MSSKANTIPKRNKHTFVQKPMPQEGFVREPAVIAFLGVSRTTFHNGIKSGKFPPGKLLTNRCRVWSATEIRALLNKP